MQFAAEVGGAFREGKDEKARVFGPLEMVQGKYVEIKVNLRRGIFEIFRRWKCVPGSLWSNCFSARQNGSDKVVILE